ncbi:MAG: RNA 2',3'-cyclic phosphodiesterase [candidate division WOR-3 bacterium]
MRVFLAFDIPDDIKTQIHDIIKEKGKQIQGVKWVERENLHITCKFLGEINNHQLEELKRSLNESFNKNERIKINLKGFGAFPNFKRPRVLWIGVDGEKEKLVNVWRKVEDITRKMRIGEPERDYTPHLTLGRVKSPMEFKPDFISYSSKEVIINTITIYQSTLTSQGPIYKKLGEVKL